jgi:hypothetical protein
VVGAGRRVGRIVDRHGRVGERKITHSIPIS